MAVSVMVNVISGSLKVSGLGRLIIQLVCIWKGYVGILYNALMGYFISFRGVLGLGAARRRNR